MTTDISNLFSSKDLHGRVVAWDMPTKEVKAQAVRDALARAGITTDLPELRPSTAFSRATKELKKDRVIRRRKSYDKDTRRTYQLNRIVEGDTIDYDYEASVELDAETGAVKCGEDAELARAIEKGVQEELETRTATDVTRIVQKLFQSHADLFPVVPRKGVAYFVPEVHSDFVSRIDEFLRLVGGKLWQFPVPKGDEGGDASVKAAVKAGLDAMVAELSEAVDGWEKDSTRQSTMVKAQERLEAIQYKCDAYAEFLQAEKEKLSESLVKAKEQLATRILELAPDEEEEQPQEQAGPNPKDVKRAASEGWDAAELGYTQEANPYTGSELQVAWQEGWTAARESQAA